MRKTWIFFELFHQFPSVCRVEEKLIKTSKSHDPMPDVEMNWVPSFAFCAANSCNKLRNKALISCSFHGFSPAAAAAIHRRLRLHLSPILIILYSFRRTTRSVSHLPHLSRSFFNTRVVVIFCANPSLSLSSHFRSVWNFRSRVLVERSSRNLVVRSMVRANARFFMAVDVY